MTHLPAAPGPAVRSVGGKSWLEPDLWVATQKFSPLSGQPIKQTSSGARRNDLRAGRSGQGQQWSICRAFKMVSGKSVLTTGEVARICSVAPRTVSKWFDTGQLRGYRIPGSKDRRIPIEQLVRFMRLHGMPLNGLATGQTRIVVLDADTALAEAMAEALAQTSGYEVRTATSVIEAGAVAFATSPHVIVVDVTLPDVVPRSISRWVRSADHLMGTRLIAVAPALTQANGQALIQDGFDAFLSKPFDIPSLVRLIEEQVPSAV